MEFRYPHGKRESPRPAAVEAPENILQSQAAPGSLAFIYAIASSGVTLRAQFILHIN